MEEFIVQASTEIYNAVNLLLCVEDMKGLYVFVVKFLDGEVVHMARIGSLRIEVNKASAVKSIVGNSFEYVVDVLFAFMRSDQTCLMITIDS